MTQTPASAATSTTQSGAWSPWRTVLAFGLVSLAADMVYEGMRATAGPFLGTLGASALTVGLVTGAGEGIALVLRLVTGVWADRSHHHWRLTVLGYAMTAVCVPLLAITPFIGVAGLAVAATLILLERTGKAVRSPAKSALLARMATATGRGKGFAVHKALDQIGAFSGPLLLAGVAAATGVLWPGFAILAIPGALSLVLLAQLRLRAPIVTEPERDDAPLPATSALVAVGKAVVGSDLPRAFHLFALATAMMTAGLMTFGVISFRLVQDGLLAAAAVPLAYALAMAVEAIAALGTGHLFDRRGGRVLLAVPVLVAIVPLCVFATQLWLVLVGIVVWGVATGIQDSTVKAYVADLVPAPRRATAYGVFAAVQGLGALAGGGLAGALVTGHVPILAAVIGGLQAVAFMLLMRLTRRESGAPAESR
ncbi:MULTISPECIES: MFS transporter [unclassified Nocardioides]|uniref:MFS transporter n=1 Tax=unclassified Nocardioides TaxID=2615069 RepID=UPI0000EB6143|nr:MULTISPECIES: MFS transporter [unclassified Nocardioides]ABL81063.1 major facilitator superfamily MFS_1 [Nocardioides sp. JS614]